ncbi:MAG: hypothetical protein ACOYJ1_03055 [Peptococcales bacterium]
MRILLANRLLATGLGSLPYNTPDEALEKIIKYFPQIPFWPQLPQRSKKELMLEAFLFPWVKEGLVKFLYGRGIFSEEPNKIDLYKEAITKHELLPRENAPGFYKLGEYLTEGRFPKAILLKGQVTGPNTLCKYNLLSSGLPLNHNQEITQGILKLVEKQLNFQIKYFKKFNLPIIIFIDEPAFLVKFYEPSYEILEEGLNRLVSSAKRKGVMIGIHSCNSPDWFRLTRLPVDMISFDAFTYELSEKDINYVADFITRGGKIAWGIVPNKGAPWEKIYGKLLKYKELMKQSGLVTSSCGLGLTSERVTEEILEQTLRVAEIVNNL